MLFSPTIGAADLRALYWHRGAAVTALTQRCLADPAGRMRPVRRTCIPVQGERCWGVLRRAQRQSVGWGV